MGIIDEELVKNLAICGAVILVVIFALVPNPRIAIWAPGMQGSDALVEAVLEGRGVENFGDIR